MCTARDESQRSKVSQGRAGTSMYSKYADVCANRQDTLKQLVGVYDLKPTSRLYTTLLDLLHAEYKHLRGLESRSPTD